MRQKKAEQRVSFPIKFSQKMLTVVFLKVLQVILGGA